MDYMQIYKARNEDYLTTIYRLREAFGFVRISDIAYELSVRPATVSKVISRLEKRGLVSREKYHYVYLTEAGEEVAERIIRKHRISENFLSKILGFDEYESHYYAHYLEHLPDEVIERIYELLGRPDKCPHGNPLPREKIESETKLIKLSKAETGSRCVIKRLVGELRRVLEFAKNHSIKIGDEITIISSSGGVVIISLRNNSRIEVPLEVSELILVECS